MNAEIYLTIVGALITYKLVEPLLNRFNAAAWGDGQKMQSAECHPINKANGSSKQH